MPEDTESGWPPWIDQWVMPFVNESGLWPVLMALIGHATVIVAPMMLSLYRGFLPSFLPLFFLGLFSMYCIGLDVRRAGRPGGVTVTVLLTWALSAGLAWVASATGVF